MGIIKTQFLTSAGGGNTLSIEVDTGSLVTITNGDIQKQATSVGGVAKFKNIKAGTWSVLATLSGQEASGQVIINDDYSLSLSYGTELSALPKGTIVKYQGMELKVVCHDHSGYPSNSTTVYIQSYTNTSTWGVGKVYSAAGCELRANVEAYASSCPLYSKMLDTSIQVVKDDGTKSNYTTKAFAISCAEAGGFGAAGTNLGFSNYVNEAAPFFNITESGVSRKWSRDRGRDYPIGMNFRSTGAGYDSSEIMQTVLLCNLSKEEKCQDNGDGTYTLI